LRSTIEQSIRNIRRTANVIEAEACFPLDAPIFQGHFPGKPIVPAMYQIALCRMVAEKYYSGDFVQVTHSRFSAACVPDVLYNIKISVEENADSFVASCSLRQRNVMHSKIVLSYDTPTTRG
jgi:3-hydroxymyristoyl/3-hydroxydecanoyl-(acyl carrier protein) dehydratase